MQLSPSRFNAFLGQIGQQVLWRRSWTCPCVNPMSGAPSTGCPQCRGKGHLWGAPVASVIGIASQSTQRRWAQFGLWESGDSVVSIPSDSPAYALGPFDRIQMLNSTDNFSSVLTRGKNDRLPFVPNAIVRVFYLMPGSSAVVDVALPDIGADGTLSWPNNDGPPPGMQYSVSGSQQPEYFVFDNFPSDRNEHSGAQLPRKVVLRRIDLLARS